MADRHQRKDQWCITQLFRPVEERGLSCIVAKYFLIVLHCFCIMFIMFKRRLVRKLSDSKAYRK